MESNLTRAGVVRIITDEIENMACTELDGLVIDTSEHKYIVKSDNSEYGWCLESIKKQ